MEVTISESQSDLIKKIAKDEGFEDFELQTTQGSAKGDNYLGVITTVSVKNHHRTLELILKSAMESEELRKRAPIRNVFLREMYLYDKVFPEFEKFEKEQGFSDGFSGHAKLYGTNDGDFNECLLLENMKSNGYQLWNRRVPMTAEHLSAVLKEYGKLHAVSFALKEKNPELYETLSQNLSNVFADMSASEDFSTLIDAVLKNGLNAVEGDQVASEAFKRFSLEVKGFLEDLMRTPTRDEHSVILHGDSWCNNILFKYEDDEKKRPSKVCLIDWQISWVSSPVVDLSYFLLTSAAKENLSNYKKFLQDYHDSLSHSLRQLNCDPEKLYPFTVLEEEWKKYVKWGVYMALTLIKLMLSDGDEVPDMKEMADSGKSFAEGFVFETAHNATYNQRVLDVVTVSAENNWI